MKRVITGIIAGIVIGSTGVGIAAANFSSHAYGIWCKSDYRTKGILCIKESGNGYGVGISKDFVMVMDLNREKAVFTRYH